mgnify:CR=1 FL=1
MSFFFFMRSESPSGLASRLGVERTSSNEERLLVVSIGGGTGASGRLVNEECLTRFSAIGLLLSEGALKGGAAGMLESLVSLFKSLLVEVPRWLEDLDLVRDEVESPSLC